MNAPLTMPAALRTLICGHDPVVQRHVSGVLLSASTYLLYFGISAVQVAFGYMDARAAVAMACCGTLMNLVFYGLARAGFGRRSSDRGLAKTQLFLGMAYMLVGYAAAGPSAASVLIVMASHIVYAMFSMPAAQVWRLVAVAVLGLAATMAGCVALWPARFEIGLQLVSLLHVMVVVPLIAVLAHRLTAMTQRLRHQQHELQAALGRLEALATRDDLTGTHNRRHMTALLQAQHEQLSRQTAPTALALLDIDHFKQINDRHGHAAGDEILRRLARVARGQLRQGDHLARWGGEEFLVLMPGATPAEAWDVLERVRMTIAQTAFDDVARGLSLTFSAGVAALSPSYTLEQAVECADRAMYRAKDGGRNRTEVDGSLASCSRVLHAMQRRLPAHAV